MIYLYYNALADNNNLSASLEPIKTKLEAKWGEKIEMRNAHDVAWEEEQKTFKEGDKVLLAGGDGTLNHFINVFDPSSFPVDIYLLPMGTGNDFLNDRKEVVDEDGLVKLNDCLKGLPTIEVKGKTYRFINGIGFGIDGDCCVVAEQMKKAGEKKIDYSKITISLLLKSFKPRNATVTIDGEKFEFKKVYLASSMFGKYYGGGMRVAPDQVRNGGLLSFVTIYGKGKIGTLMMFPKIFSGTHVKYKKNVFIKTGKEIVVTFDKPCGLQIDGEVVEDVTTYKVFVK